MGRGKSLRAGLPPVVLLSLALTSTAHAHMMVEGAGQLGNGALHPWMTPAHVLVLLGLALLSGQQVPLDLKTLLRVFTPLSAIALVLTIGGKMPTVAPPVLTGLALILGILVGLGRPLPRWVLGVLGGAAAIGIGLDSGVETGSTFDAVKTLLGTWLSMNAVVVYLAICASNGAGREWARIAIRILGSWIIAISLMVLAFSLRK